MWPAGRGRWVRTFRCGAATTWRRRSGSWTREAWRRTPARGIVAGRAMTDLAAAHAHVWSVVNFQQEVLGHRLTLPEALRRILEVVLELDYRNDSGQYWPLFMIASTPLDGEGWRSID